MQEFVLYCGLILVGLIWGITNPYLELGVKNKQQFGNWKQFLSTLVDFEFIVPFGINQGGSLLFYFLLGHTPLSIGPVVANCVSTATTIVMESKLKHQPIKRNTSLGIILICIGMYFCLS
jgi:drug/metabolite transporter (DMT)-like permease